MSPQNLELCRIKQALICLQQTIESPSAHLPHCSHPSYYRGFLQHNCIHHSYCQTERISAGERVATLLDKYNAIPVPSGSCLAGSCITITQLSLSGAKGDAQSSTGLKTTQYKQHRTVQTCAYTGSLLHGSPTPRCAMVFPSASLQKPDAHLPYRNQIEQRPTEPLGYIEISRCPCRLSGRHHVCIHQVPVSGA